MDEARERAPDRISSARSTSTSRARSPNRVYVLIEAPRRRPGSTDRTTRARAGSRSNPGDASRLLAGPFYYTYIDVDPKNADIVWVNNLSFLKSTDGGRTLTHAPTPHGDNHGMWINPDNPNYIIQSNDGGANVSIERRAQSWSTQHNQPTAELYQVEVDDQFPYRLYGAQQDNGTLDRAEQAAGLRTHESADAFGSGSWLRNRPDQAEAGRSEHRLRRVQGRVLPREPARPVRSRATGCIRRTATGTRRATSAIASSARRRSWLSPHDPNVIYHGSHVLHRSADGGLTWEVISPDLTANEPERQGISGEPITRDITGEEVYSTIYAIEESPLERASSGSAPTTGRFTSRAMPARRGRRSRRTTAARRARAEHRAVAAPARLGVHRRLSLPAERLAAVHLSHRRLRQDLDAADGRRATASLPIT